AFEPAPQWTRTQSVARRRFVQQSELGKPRQVGRDRRDLASVIEREQLEVWRDRIVPDDGPRFADPKPDAQLLEIGAARGQRTTPQLLRRIRDLEAQPPPR